MLSLRPLSRISPKGPICRYKHSSTPRLVETDSLGMPLKPTWSVHELLSSYPSPKLPPDTLRKLYTLSALVPPEAGTPEHAKVTKELEEMVRLVEAVRLVTTQGVVVAGRGEKEDMDRKHYGNPDDDREDGYGQELLQHAARTVDGYYVVETDRTRRTSSAS
ncbi:hypothetical protein DFP72DRAFT_567377 [Ephemerocybe angulata]|uniref:Uncharacterized protein n=1 Tax=Ephemerocybe angulata TaxID=980116 RepID=A0A8H6IC35_9AGAR|nr:hypothetical protein DFP72DRAFT_567377 [Tulosesus angulatus]